MLVSALCVHVYMHGLYLLWYMCTLHMPLLIGRDGGKIRQGNETKKQWGGEKENVCDRNMLIKMCTSIYVFFYMHRNHTKDAMWNLMMKVR